MHSVIMKFLFLTDPQNLILAENSDTAKSWLNPDPKFDTLLKAHIFHYPNIDDYLAGRADKIKVVDVGPLTYQEHTVKDEVSFNKNFTVSFRVRLLTNKMFTSYQVHSHFKHK